MCGNQKLEDIGEDAAIDRNLIALWRQWRRYVSLFLFDADMPEVDWIDSFCTDMRENLTRLEAEGRLSASADDRGPAGGEPAGFAMFGANPARWKIRR